MLRSALALATAGSLAVLSGCAPSYSPNTYDADAVQQANAVQRGVVIGVRRVKLSANATVGTVTGAAAGGIAGSTVDGGGPIKAFSALGGSVVGGLLGSGVQHAEGDTTAFEYIVRESNNNLVSVTQRDKTPLPIGEKVLVIAGKQARIVADYTVSLPNPQASATPATTAHRSGAQAASGAATVVPLSTAGQGGATARKSGAASGGAVAQTAAPVPPSSSSATRAGGPSGDSAATGATAAAVAAVLASPSGNAGNPVAAAAEPVGPAPAGTVALPSAASTAAAAAGGGTAASTAAKKTTAPNAP